MEYLDEDLELFSDGSVHDATLAHDTEIQGLPCAGGNSVVYFPSGMLRLAYLSRPAAIGVIECSAYVVYVHENGVLLNGTLESPREFAGIVVSKDERITLDDDGQLLEYTRRLPEDQKIDGLPVSAAYRPWFYPCGRPSAVILATPTVVGGREYPRGARLSLEEDGQVLDSSVIDLDSGTRYKEHVFGVYEAPYT